jgi:hypothetical protein
MGEPAEITLDYAEGLALFVGQGIDITGVVLDDSLLQELNLLSQRIFADGAGR